MNKYKFKCAVCSDIEDQDGIVEREVKEWYPCKITTQGPWKILPPTKCPFEENEPNWVQVKE